MSESVGRGVGASGNAANSPARAGDDWRQVRDQARDSGVGRRNDDRVVRLLYFRQPRRGVVSEILSARQRHVRLHRISRDVCRRIFGAAVWRAVFRADWRCRRAEVRVSRDAFHHGRGDGGDRVAPVVQNGGLACADHAAADSRAARAGAGRRIRRRDGLCRGACARRQAWILHELHSDHGDAGIVRVAAGDSGNAKRDEQRNVCRLGLADSVFDFDRAGVGVAIHPVEDERVADLRADQERGNDVGAAAEGRVCAMGESEARADFAVRRDRRDRA